MWIGFILYQFVMTYTLMTIYNRLRFRLLLLISYFLSLFNFNIKYFSKSLCGSFYHLDLRYYIDRLIFVNDSYELDDIKNLASVVRKNNLSIFNFIDVGSNIGVYSIYFSKAFSSADVYAIEPCRDTFSRLLRNITLNNLNIFPLNFALADDDGVLDLIHSNTSSILFGINSGMNSIVNNEDKGRSDSSYHEKVLSVSPLSLKNQIINSKLPFVIKFDIEEYELTVISHIIDLISDSPLCVLQVELLFSEKKMQSNCFEIVDMLISFGFLPLSTSYDYSGNYIFIRESNEI